MEETIQYYMNQFGGNWTEIKIKMVVDYAKAYLTIMNKYPRFKTIYFDGFAGSGDIYKDNTTDIEAIKGTAIRILEINAPRAFDMYYFVEMDEGNKSQLEQLVNASFPDKKHHIVCDDCNRKLVSMTDFLKANADYRVLAFIDPYGMAVNWGSIEVLKGHGIDLWILVPTGIGVNRLLKTNGDISDAWLNRLEIFLGLDRQTILSYFYKQKKSFTLFGEETIKEKEVDAIEKAAKLYRERLNEVFKFVSEPLPLSNSTGSIMYHFMLASNNQAALKIANDLINKK